MTIVDRIKNIMLTPKSEWQVIHSEGLGIQDIYLQYFVLVAALPAAGQLLSMGRFGNFHSALRMAIITYVATLVGTYVSALVIEYLAENFSSTRDRPNAFRLIAYGTTPTLIAGTLVFLPNIGVLASLAGVIYTIYLFYLGLPILMGTPEDKVLQYMAVAFVAVVVSYSLIGWILASFFGVTFLPL